MKFAAPLILLAGCVTGIFRQSNIQINDDPM